MSNKSQEAYNKYGSPAKHANMTLFIIPDEFYIETMPKRIYCNKSLVAPLKNALSNLIIRGYADEIKTFDGCFCIRLIRGGSQYSLHSWGLALDFNAFENGLGQTPRLSEGFVKCFTDAGFDWGGNFKRKDGMHFELKSI